MSEPRKLTAIVIPASHDDPMWTVELENPDLRDFQNLVSGLIEFVDLPHGASFMANDEAKNYGMPVNYRATALLWALRTEFIDVDTMNGDVVIVGQPDAEGNTTSAPDLYVQLLVPS